MRIGNTTLIPQNVASPDAVEAVICDSGGNIVARCSLGHLAMPDVGTKRYSSGILFDLHTREEEYDSATDLITDSQQDLERAISYFATDAGAEMLVAGGDLVEYQQALPKHKEIINANKGDMEIYELAGNHEHFIYPSGTESILSSDEIREYTGYPLYYTVSGDPTDEERRNYYSPTVGDDVFILCGAVKWAAVFDAASIQWLYDVLERYRNRRCFLFMHCFLKGSQYCGDSAGIINTVDMTATYKQTFVSLLEHYQNVIYFHGHSHVMAQMQDYLQSLESPLPANYDNTHGHSFHIPSLARPRDISDGTRVEMPGESQGVLMDVYDNHVVMRYIDFVAGGFIPIAQYCIDTTLVEIPAGTFTDSTGIITT